MKAKFNNIRFFKKEKKDNINFFKKIYYATCKIKEYTTLSKLGLRKSINYMMDLILICSIIYSGIITLQIKKNATGLRDYLEQNFPNLTYENSKITSDTQDRVILNDDLVIANFGGQIVIDTVTEYEELINKYKKEGNKTILLTTDKYVTINSQGTTLEYNYSEIINTNGEEQTVIGKDYFVKLFSNISYGYYFFVYLLGGAIGISIIIILYNLLLTIAAFIPCKIKKVKIKFREIFSMGIYAQTWGIVGHFIMVFLPVSAIPYAQVLSITVPVGYLVYAIYINKWIMPERK